ncbi:MAG TPA: hypothetical protein VFI24_21795 [Pyrinomonadaceae bacterium]|nr:hypothetical protein [Pyrinomonadaceae bacterium]
MIPDRLPSLIVLVGFWIPPAVAGWVVAEFVRRSTRRVRAVVIYAVLATFMLGYAAAWFLFNLGRMPPYIPGASTDPTFAAAKSRRGSYHCRECDSVARQRAGWRVSFSLLATDNSDSGALSIMNVPDDFSKKLRETIAWCVPRVNTSNPKYCLRSPQLKPDYEFSSRPDQDVDLWADVEMINKVVDSRSKLSSAGEESSTEVNTDLAGGRLLIHFLFESNHNGATADITSYYLDHNDTPPWDTWVDVFVPESLAHQSPDEAPSEYAFLISWVPAEFIDTVHEATEFECVAMLMWADTPRTWEAPPEYTDSIPAWLQQLS